jgi:hypothetical protein
LLAEALPFARQSLAKHGEFYPYGMVLTLGGETRMVAADEGSEHPASTDLLAMLYEGLSAQGPELRGVAVVSDVRIKEPLSDAIRVEVEHREGVAMAVLLPYQVRKKLLGRDVTYGDMRASGAHPRIWPASDSAN